MVKNKIRNVGVVAMIILTGMETNVHRRINILLVAQSQDWNLLYSSESNGINIFKFTRKIKSCDKDDMIIDQGSPYVIYAYGEKDPIDGGDISYHGMNRGGKVVSFISSSSQSDTFVADDHEIIDIVISNVILPKENTYYYCEMFHVPKEFNFPVSTKILLKSISIT
ncbi:unnamed protein product [Brachionus calyciflorus]|uniref:DOMON domain-containing protein n=1 Tax=Brachionus calyciflorus TaxID=104777 RepID=A0A813WF49_9BILA|nr:unnamed protein product [Brachionus calyciflorus]